MDRITEIRLANLRSLDDVRLTLGPMTVLIGENGSGKSSLCEALAVARHLPNPRFMDTFHQVHGGMAGLLRAGQNELAFGFRIEDSNGREPPLDYEIRLLAINSHVQVANERLESQGTPVLERTPSGIQWLDRSTGRMEEDGNTRPGEVLLGTFGPRSAHPAVARMSAALEGIEVHLPWEVIPAWACRSLQRVQGMRGTTMIAPADRVGLLGTNLANVYASLKNDHGGAHWQDTMDYLRLGLGDDLESVNVRADPGGGHVGLSVQYAGMDRQIYASALSDGMLAWMAFVALYRLPQGKGLLVFDEPDLHFHPRLADRVVDLLENISETRPVVITTQSDRVLDALTDPAGAVVTCELNRERSTRLRRPDPQALAKWLERYAGYGEVRNAGHEQSILGEPLP